MNGKHFLVLTLALALTLSCGLVLAAPRPVSVRVIVDSQSPGTEGFLAMDVGPLVRQTTDIVPGQFQLLGGPSGVLLAGGREDDEVPGPGLPTLVARALPAAGQIQLVEPTGQVHREASRLAAWTAQFCTGRRIDQHDPKRGGREPRANHTDPQYGEEAPLT